MLPVVEGADTSVFMAGWTKSASGTFTNDGTFYILNGSDLGSNTRVFAYIETSCAHPNGCDLSLTWSWRTTDCAACDPVKIVIGGVGTQLVHNGDLVVPMHTTNHTAANQDIIQFGIDSLNDLYGPSILTIADIVISEILLPSSTPTVAPTPIPKSQLPKLAAGAIAGIVIGSLVVAALSVVVGYFLYKQYGDNVTKYLSQSSIKPAPKSTQILVRAKPEVPPAAKGVNFVVVDDAIIHPEKKASPAPPARSTKEPQEGPSDHIYATKPINYSVLSDTEYDLENQSAELK